MSKILIETAELDREAWLKARQRGIGSSDAAAVVGANPYRGPLTVYMDKTGQLQDDRENEAMYWGTRLEEVVADEFCRRLGEELETEVKVRRRNAILQHDEHPFILANLDRYYYVNGSRGVLECKTSGAWMGKDWQDTSVPVLYYLQVQHQLAVTGLSHAYLAVLIGGQLYKHYSIERSEKVVGWLIEEERKFWGEHVLPGIPPPADGTESTRRALELLYPAAREEAWVQLDEKAEELAEEYVQANEAMKVAKKRKEAAANGLKSLLGEAETGFAGAYRIDWKNRCRKEYTVPAKTYRHFQIHGGES